MNKNLEAEFIQKGCKSRKDAAVAVQVYLELCEVKRYWDVLYFYNNTLEKVYFTARRNKAEDSSIFVPVAVSESISFIDLQRLFTLDTDSQVQSIYIVIAHSDSTCVYYQIANGLGEPPPINAKIVKGDKSQKLDADLRKNREILEQAALYGIPVTIPKKEKTEVTNLDNM